MSQREPEPPRFCPNCGARTSPGLTHCAACGHPLAEPEEMARLWGTSPPADAEVIDLYPPYEPSLQTTTPFSQTRPFEPQDRGSASWEVAEPEESGTGSGKRGKRGKRRQEPPLFVERKPGGPPGCVLGCLAVLLIAVVGVAVVWNLARDFVGDRVEEEISVGIQNEVRTIDAESAIRPGRITLTEDQINSELREHAGQYDPIENVTVALEPDRVVVRFDLYGTTSTFRGGLNLRNGRIVVVEPSLSGPAGRIVDIDEIADVFERELAELLSRSGLRPTAISVGDDAIVVRTAAN
jgi:hypothetical protein